jgi:hypothetical protein
MEHIDMIDNDSTPLLQKTAVIWSERRERDISVRIYYDAREEDGCKIFTLRQVEELW